MGRLCFATAIPRFESWRPSHAPALNLPLQGGVRLRDALTLQRLGVGPFRSATVFVLGAGFNVEAAGPIDHTQPVTVRGVLDGIEARRPQRSPPSRG